LKSKLEAYRPIDTSSKWSHDKYNLDEQAPKTAQDLIKTYGYDIRKDSKISSQKDNSFSNSNEYFNQKSERYWFFF
jgi:hypothetical protein